MESMKEPLIAAICQKVGEPLNNVRVKYNVAELKGFLPVESPDRDGSTLYIAIDNIVSITIKDEESFCIKSAFSR